MRALKGNFRSRAFSQAGAVALVAAVTAGCSVDVSRFGDSLITGSTSNQKSIVNGQKKSPTYDEIVTGSTKPSSSSSSMSSSVAVYDPPASAAPATKSGWTTAGGTRVTVRDGDTVSSMSRRYGVPQNAIMEANPTIGDPNRLAAGQQVVIPTYVHSDKSTPTTTVQASRRADDDDIVTGSVSPVATAPATQSYPSAVHTANVRPVAKPGRHAAARTTTGGAKVHVVNAGDTVSSIAARHDIRHAELIAANGLSDGNKIRIGQRLTIPAPGTATRTAAAPQAPRTTAATGAGPVPARKPERSTRVASVRDDVDPVVTGSIPKNAATEPQDDASAVTRPATPQGRSFRWPVRGRVISEFGAKPNGQHNDGINLAVPEGTSVKAAEDGVVIYSGNELKGYGNLVLVRHSDGWVTAYAHNSALNVERGDSVRRGQVLAKAGATGSVDQPQVHFELRKGSRPVDPMPYLAGS